MNIPRKQKSTKGSVLVFSLIILAIMLSAALSVLGVSIIEKKSSLSTGKAVQSFNVAQAGIERTLQAWRKDPNLTDLASLTSAIGGTCTDGAGSAPAVVSINPLVGGSTTLTFKDGTGTDIGSCAADVNTLSTVRSLGIASGTSRAIETGVQGACFQMHKTAFSGHGNDAPQGVAYDSYTNSIWVKIPSSEVRQIDPRTGTVLTAITVSGGAAGDGLAFNPHNHTLWVANSAASTITVIDVADVNNQHTYPSYGGPTQMIYDSGNRVMWVVQPTSNAISAFDESDPTQRKDFWTNFAGTDWGGRTQGMINQMSRDWKNPQAIAYDDVNHFIWVSYWDSWAGPSSSGVVRFDPTKLLNNTSGAATAVGLGVGEFTGIAYDPSRGTRGVVWASTWDTVAGGKAVFWVDVNDLSHGHVTVTVGNGSPWGIVYDSISRSVWVAMSSGSVSRIKPDNSVTNLGPNTFPGTFFVTFDPMFGYIWANNVNEKALYEYCVQ
jgi:hypothetical protein